MKKQIKNTLRTAIAIIFLATLQTITACNERKESTQNTAASETRAKPPATDIHAAVMTDNMEALRQHIAAGSNLNEKDPLGVPVLNSKIHSHPGYKKQQWYSPYIKKVDSIYKN